jgi:site-specific DNA-methyltransferase (adenine-specific)
MSGDGIMRTWADLEEGHNVKGFMGKSWDSAVPCHNFFAECLRVVKHGGHMIAFSSTRTVCALGMAAQQGGWRVRDMLHWCYFSGFPKSHDISKAIDREAGTVREVVGYDEEKAKRLGKMPSVGAVPFRQKENMKKRLVESGFVGVPITKPATQDAQIWDGFGTALKPAVEPALLLRKPLEQGLTIAQNVLKHGTGALNIDACRFGYGDPCWVGPQEEARSFVDRGREASGTSYNWANTDRKERVYDGARGRWPANLYQCAKASRSEREEGLDHLKNTSGADLCRDAGNKGLNSPRAGAGRTRCEDGVKNFHPTVKPLRLMRWCCRLVGGQRGSTILDPFAGSGTTLMAGILEGFNVVGMEMTDDYMPIIEGRVQWAKEQYKRENAQLSLFGDLK